jgi:predicted DNA-binding protein (UPF0251 family)/predicted Fe-Mo cluster-binding NifX family protein
MDNLNLPGGSLPMPRPRKSRNVCHFPSSLSFVPAERENDQEPVQLTVDEYETLRLVDLEGFSQEDCGKQMGVARTTIQQIYASARRKLARMLVEGRALQIAGGDYRLCDGGQDCGQSLCFKQFYSKSYEKPEHCQRIVVCCAEEGIICCFEDTRQIKLYDVRKNRVTASQTLEVTSSDQNLLACILTALRTDILICGHISGGTGLALDAAGIRVQKGISGDADAAAAAILSEK